MNKTLIHIQTNQLIDYWWQRSIISHTTETRHYGHFWCDVWASPVVFVTNETCILIQIMIYTCLDLEHDDIKLKIELQHMRETLSTFTGSIDSACLRFSQSSNMKLLLTAPAAGPAAAPEQSCWHCVSGPVHSSVYWVTEPVVGLHQPVPRVEL